ncbi:16S rRNA (adenine(1518)-N(6)/adenine(1519)-N(6))-dimethyltransferase RsmA [Clostridium sp. HCP1S3_B4]|uniref:16S rRNA (adenine(1518)-N(6)/adenine(1519)-N(6))- dimethyltransferase RsmA n=1 Tax=unclassified Clostridium TaxID=2614128 RepID=UPI0016A99833|nr:16S rRNA (adenine(1518)-N(6)/adenine(1519)-N(6))-dimethyltransferase RsmA [Clostridiales bacterium]MDY2729865.1 16S rRNA (adenine(1518)-N(6)/adenine(1519)-N(6))-dimethyltransferase RsmA [Clostridium sp.]NLK24683.1 16S rRNA (adenine(1518)-N(6)/adenine(1519)-N(6))-dimethyltransferase RsmA [Clostridiales bacterium]
MDIKNYSTQEIVKKYNFKFSKSLGQNFLHDESILDSIVEGADVCKDDLVIEIGPGVGSLTAKLLQKAAEVVSIELDNDLIPILENELSQEENFTLIHDDALKVDFKEIIKDHKSVKLVANLPYYVTTPIIVKLLKEQYNFKSLTIMIQKEVAERIDAEPNCKEYGSLSLLVQYYCNTKIIKRVSPGAFIPQPKVDSIVIRLDRLEKPRVDVTDEDLMFKIIRNAFNMRRKTLLNGVKFLNMKKEDILKAFENASIDPKRRGETLSLEEFRNLTEEIIKLR